MEKPGKPCAAGVLGKKFSFWRCGEDHWGAWKEEEKPGRCEGRERLFAGWANFPRRINRGRAGNISTARRAGCRERGRGAGDVGKGFTIIDRQKSGVSAADSGISGEYFHSRRGRFQQEFPQGVENCGERPAKPVFGGFAAGSRGLRPLRAYGGCAAEVQEQSSCRVQGRALRRARGGSPDCTHCKSAARRICPEGVEGGACSPWRGKSEL